VEIIYSVKKLTPSTEEFANVSKLGMICRGPQACAKMVLIELQKLVRIRLETTFQ